MAVREVDKLSDAAYRIITGLVVEIVMPRNSIVTKFCHLALEDPFNAAYIIYEHAALVFLLLIFAKCTTA